MTESAMCWLGGHLAGASGNLTTLCYNDNTEGSIAERVKALCHGRTSLQLHAGASKCCFAQHQGEPSEFRKELQRWLGHPCYPNGPSTPFIILFLVLGIKPKTLPMLESASSGTTFPSQTLSQATPAGWALLRDPAFSHHGQAHSYEDP